MCVCVRVRKRVIIYNEVKKNQQCNRQKNTNVCSFKRTIIKQFIAWHGRSFHDIYVALQKL